MTSNLSSLSLSAIPPADEALRQPVRDFVQAELVGTAPDLRARSWLGFSAEFSRALGAQGLIGLTMPREHGGAGRSAFARFVMIEEMLAAGAPVAGHWVADRQTAPLILHYGTPAQREFFLPRIIAGEMIIAIGLSEPDTGSDLASVRTRAVRTETGWRINGRKIWTSNAHRAHYTCALVRTSGTPDDRHKGLSQLLIDMSLPGVSVRPIPDIAGDSHFCEVLFEDVDVPADALLGEEGSGWRQVTSELAFERSGPERIYSSLVLVETWLAELRQLGEVPLAVQAIAGRMAGRMAVLRAMSIAVAACLEAGENPEQEASLVKDLGTEFEQAVQDWIAQALELTPGHEASDALLRTLAYVSLISPTYSIRGGTRHIMRSIIARGIGLR
ncbi:acyl-CoA dehydrogenase family protein [Cupriavidus oxalaticus]|uniref:Acyl-CoA dehydrogenase n=1 Tax=Cupriavidus oxalaticus TaxID=96344 RepID=A0A4P7LHX6_9BURK|nr:acyl-CoA dehydrogenase family protein [Cupriavidus oxalaticus]QBY55395.1 acyl-CoA dehydrogenase [Cupriavidus oxalaticus]